MRKNDERSCPPPTSVTPCRRSSSSSSASSSSSSPTNTQIFTEEFPAPQIIAKPKTKHRSKPKSKPTTTPKPTDDQQISPAAPANELLVAEVTPAGETNELIVAGVTPVYVLESATNNNKVDEIDVESVSSEELESLPASDITDKVEDVDQCTTADLVCVTEDTVVVDSAENLEECPDSWEEMDLTAQHMNSEYQFLEDSSVDTNTEHLENEPAVETVADSIETTTIDNDNSEGLNNSEVENIIPEVIGAVDYESVCPSSETVADTTDNCCYLVSSAESTSDSTNVLDMYGSVSQPPTLTVSDILFTSTLNPAAQEFHIDHQASVVQDNITFDSSGVLTEGDVQMQQACYAQTYVPYVGLNIPNEGVDTPATATTATSGGTVIQHHPTPHKQFYTWSYVNSEHGFYYGIPTPLELFSANGQYYFAAAQPQVNEKMQQILQQNGLPLPTDTTQYTHARQFYVMHQSVQYAPEQQSSLSADRFVERLLEEQQAAMNTTLAAAEVVIDETTNEPSSSVVEESVNTPTQEFTEGDPDIYPTAFPPLTDAEVKNVV